MNFKEIQDLIKLVEKTSLAEFKLKDGNFEILIRSKDFIKTKHGSNDVAPIYSVAPAAPVAQVATPTPAAAAPAVQQNTAAPAPEEATTPAASNLLEIKSPIVGTFYRSASPDKPPYVKVGDTVKSGDVVCIVEAMKLFNEIETEVSGKIVKVMVEDATPVEYDQVLFLVEPA